MGVIYSAIKEVFFGVSDDEDSEEKASLISRKIDISIKKENWDRQNLVKLLLLGPSESGKSTLLRQLTIIKGGGYTDDERNAFKPKIFENVITSLATILSTMSSNGIEFCDPSGYIEAEVFNRVVTQLFVGEMSQKFGLIISNLWNDPSTKKAYELLIARPKTHAASPLENTVLDSAEYFLESIERLSAPDYIPSDEDLLRVCIPTKSINEGIFDAKGMTFHVTDVGGSHSERLKWINCFNDVSAILFVVSLTDYDDFRTEYSTDVENLDFIDTPRRRIHIRNRVSRMDESMYLFRRICSLSYFRKTAVLLFLNKIDAYVRRLKYSPLSKIFVDEFDEKDDGNIKHACFFMLKKYVHDSEKESDRCEHVYCHFSCAIGALGNTEFVLNAVTDMIIKSHLESIGMY